jgi:putative heme-binding domain-containing protein
MAVLLAAALVVSSGQPAGAQDTHPGEYAPVDIENGRRIYQTQCVSCHGATGTGVGGIDLRRGTFRRVASDDDLRRVLLDGVPAAGMPKFDFNAVEQQGVVAYIRAGFDVGGRAVKIGDAARGRAVFEGKGGCISCHRVTGTGARKAPDLTDIGALRSASMLQQSVVDPTAYLLPINRPVRAVTKDGRTISGRRLNEDTYTVQLVDDNGRLVSLTKSDLKEYRVLTTSPMPSFRTTLSSDEISDLVAYMLSLKG